MQIVITIDAGASATVAAGETPGSVGLSAVNPTTPAAAAASGAIDAGPAPAGPGAGGPLPFVVADAARGSLPSTDAGDASAGPAPGSVADVPAVTVHEPNGSGGAS